MREIEICTLNGTKWMLGDESPEPMTWDDAKAWCESIGQELPTRDVLLMAYINPETRSEFAKYHYWSSTEHDSLLYAWLQFSSNGSQSASNKNLTLPVRAVRAIKVEKLLAQPEHEADRRSDPISKLRNLRDIQGRKGNYDIDEYMRGLFNGLELSLSIFEDRGPDYKEHIAQPEIREILTQKRKPINTKRITLEMFSAGIDINYKDGYVAGIRWAEHQHGIGGGE